VPSRSWHNHTKWTPRRPATPGAHANATTPAPSTSRGAGRAARRGRRARPPTPLLGDQRLGCGTAGADSPATASQGRARPAPGCAPPRRGHEAYRPRPSARGPATRASTAPSPVRRGARLHRVPVVELRPRASRAWSERCGAAGAPRCSGTGGWPQPLPQAGTGHRLAIMESRPSAGAGRPVSGQVVDDPHPTERAHLVSRAVAPEQQLGRSRRRATTRAPTTRQRRSLARRRGHEEDRPVSTAWPALGLVARAAQPVGASDAPRWRGPARRRRPSARGTDGRGPAPRAHRPGTVDSASPPEPTTIEAIGSDVPGRRRPGDDSVLAERQRSHRHQLVL
jgi:hypothetical protein